MFILDINDLILAILTFIVYLGSKYDFIPKGLCCIFMGLTGVIGYILAFMDILCVIKWCTREPISKASDYLGILSVTLEEVEERKGLAIDLFTRVNRISHERSITELHNLQQQYQTAFVSQNTPWEA